MQWQLPDRSSSRFPMLPGGMERLEYRTCDALLVVKQHLRKSSSAVLLGGKGWGWSFSQR
jgi:hypothetical protein